MSNRRLTVWIDGKEVLPVRALPYVTTSPRFRPEVLARRFAERDPFDRTWNLTARAYIGEDSSYCVAPEDWREVVKGFDDFLAVLKEQFPTGTVGNNLWMNGVVTLLPSCWFVTLDEFEKAFHRDKDGMFDKKRPDEEITLSPDIEIKTWVMVIEGFENCAESKGSAMPPHQLQVEPVALTETTSNSSIHKIGLERITADRAFLLDCEKKGVPMNIESIWLHIRNNAEKENFLFKTNNNKTATTVDGKQVKKENLARVLVDFLKDRKTQ